MRVCRLGVLVLSGVAACTNDTTGAGEVLVVAEVVIAPSGAGLVVGATQQFTASPRTSSGIPVPGRPVTWSSSDAGIATVSAGGLVTAVALGEALITARVDQAHGTVQVNVSPKPVASVSVTPSQVGLQVGQSQPLQVVTLDAQGDTLTGRSVTFVSDAPAIATVSSGGVVTAVAVGATVIRARSEGKEGTASITVTPRPATRLGFTTQPPNAAAGQAFGPVRVAIQDDLGGTVTGSTVPVTLALSDNPGNAALGGTLTVNAVSGVATFTNLVLTKAGTGYTLRATSGSLSPALSSPFTIAAGPAAALGITTQPSPTAQSGVPLPIGPVVQIQDAQGNPVAQAGVQITAALEAGGATLSGALTVTTGTNGAAVFSGLVLSGSAGTYPLRFTATGLTPAVSDPIALAASILIMATQPSATAVNGSELARQPAVRIADRNGTPISQSGVPVTVSLSGTGMLTGTLSAATDGSGLATFAGLTITGAVGQYRLVFTAPSLPPVSSDLITLTPGPATQVRIAVQPPVGAQSGAPLNPQPEIQAADQSGNPTGAAGIAVTASLASGTGTLGGGLTVSTNPSGRAAYATLAISGPAGSYTLRFTTATVGSVDSDPVALGAGSPTQLSMAQQPSSSAPSGQPFGAQPAVQLRDGANNPVSLAGVTITASIATGGGTLVGPATAVTNGSGVATFTGLGISGLVGSRTLQFGAAGLTPVQSQPILITPGPAARLALVQQPSATAASGEPFAQQPIVQLQDAAGNNVSQAAVPVTVALSANPGGTLGGGMLALTNGSGQAVYSGLAITGTSGAYSLQFTSGTLTPVVSTGIALGAGAGVKLAIATPPPASVKNGSAFGATIQLQDASNNPVTQAGVQVVVTLLSGDPALGGTTSVATDANGQALFTALVLTGKVGGRTIIFAATGYASATSGTITVTPGDPVALVISTPPSATAQSGVPLAQQPGIGLEDQSGNAVGQAGVVVTASLTGGGSLANPTATTDGSGGATFAGLTITGLAGVKSLDFGAAGLSGTSSGSITLSAGAASQMTNGAPLAQTAPVQTAVPLAPSVVVTDGGGNPIAGVEVIFSVTLGGGTISPPGPVATNASGVASLASWTLGAAAGTDNNTVTASAAGLQGSPITFTASATAGPAASIAANSDPDQTATAGTTVAEPPSVVVTDAGGNPVSGVNVTFSVSAGGGSTVPASPAVVSTNGSGVATLTSWTLGGTAGPNVVQATAAGLDGSPVGFTATGTVGAAGQIAANSDQTQTATVGTPVTEPPSVKVTDSGGNPVPGVTVTFAVTAGGGILDPADGIRQTDAGGIATLSGWTLGTTAGPNTVTATAAGVTGEVSFAATGLAGPAANLTFVTAPSTAATSGTPLDDQPVIEVTDAHGNLVGPTTITVELQPVSGGPGTLGGTTTAQTVNGVATFTGLSITGPGTYRLSFSAPGAAGLVSGDIVVTAPALSHGNRSQRFSVVVAHSELPPAHHLTPS